MAARNEVMVHLRLKDRSVLTTLVVLEETTIAEVRLLESNGVVNITGNDRAP